MQTFLIASGDIYVGQRVMWVVELLVPGYFSGAPAFDLSESKSLLIVPPGESPTVSNAESDGISYNVQRHEFSVFARTAGEQTIQPMTVRFHFKRHPLDTTIVSVAMKTDEVRFTTRLPPGAEALGTVISARDLQAIETWTPELTKARAGDAFTRTITFIAMDLPAMLFPPFPASQIEGLGIYPNPPDVREETERGEMRSLRRESFTYVCKRPGHYRIPAVRLTWWDLDALQLRTVEFPQRILDVESNPSLAAAPGRAENRSKWMHAIKRLGVLVLMLAFAVSPLLGWRLFGGRIKKCLRPVHLSPLNPGDK